MVRTAVMGSSRTPPQEQRVKPSILPMRRTLLGWPLCHEVCALRSLAARPYNVPRWRGHAAASALTDVHARLHGPRL